MELSRLSQIESLWSKRVGSSKLSERDELARIKVLLKRGSITYKQARNLFYLTKFWKSIRGEVIERDGHACVKCSSVIGLQVDHVRYRGIGEESMDDLQTLCADCHQEKSTKTIYKPRYIVKMKATDDLSMVMRRSTEGLKKECCLKNFCLLEPNTCQNCKTIDRWFPVFKEKGAE